jgi:nucleotide-binding universal stress UspA family protein
MYKNHSSSEEMIASPSTGYESKNKTILFATDFSLDCRAALDLATTLARNFDSRLLIMHVEQPFVPYGGGEIYSDQLFDHHSRVLLKLLHEVKPSNPHVPYCHRLVCGDPATEILRVAGEIDPYMIVMSTHGRRGLPRVIVGSVAEFIIRRATCPVVVYKSATANDQDLAKKSSQEVKS